MPGRLGARFAMEAVFLVALAIAMGLADLSSTAIVAVMAVAWLLVAIIEWLASRGAGHGGSWTPPAYAPREAWRESEPEAETALVPPAEEASFSDEDTEDPLVSPNGEPEERRKWFRRKGSGEASRAES